ncbi:MAG: hypothetical protein FJY85_25355, partial [Deltaproteobacteria bacterium]|nr:hypothetical protein [Deltaproteobacteria bacterium]
ESQKGENDQEPIGRDILYDNPICAFPRKTPFKVQLNPRDPPGGRIRAGLHPFIDEGLKNIYRDDVEKGGGCGKGEGAEEQAPVSFDVVSKVFAQDSF